MRVKIFEHLLEALPEINGVSSRNLKYMRIFTEKWSDQKIVQRIAAHLENAIFPHRKRFDRHCLLNLFL